MSSSRDSGGGHGSPHRRATPTQARSAVTVQAILSAAAALLDAEGLLGFNTNAVARSAGVNVATLYHYFPNKTAILRELLDRGAAARIDLVMRELVKLETTSDLGGWMHSLAVNLLAIRRAESYSLAVRRACRVIPELMAAEGEMILGLAGRLAVALRRRSPRLTEVEAKAAARTIVETTLSMLDIAHAEPETADAMVGALVTMLRGYFLELERPAAAA